METEPTTPTEKLKKKRAPKAPRAPRVIDPQVLKIRQEASQKVKDYHKSQASGRILKTILDKRIPQLTRQDQERLFDELKAIVTPALPLGIQAAIETERAQ